MESQIVTCDLGKFIVSLSCGYYAGIPELSNNPILFLFRSFEREN